uniref:Aminotran_1_2 domain-containing protein n=1 Tax=Macrostomum lignano TaxID=282301 RepID=A0A1I8JMC6_9PLAT
IRVFKQPSQQSLRKTSEVLSSNKQQQQKMSLKRKSMLAQNPCCGTISMVGELCLPEGADRTNGSAANFKEASYSRRDPDLGAGPFSIYRTLAESLGIEARSYNLLADRQWEVDLAHLEESIDDRTAAHPDEIYAHFVLPRGHEFHWFASVESQCARAQLLRADLTKRWLVPGWRQGWIVVYDAKGHFAEVRQGLLALSTRILGPNTRLPGISLRAIPDILEFTPPEFYASTLKCHRGERQAKLRQAQRCAGTPASDAEGAMYMMVGFSQSEYPDFPDEMAFTERLVTEQSVFCLPLAASRSACSEV